MITVGNIKEILSDHLPSLIRKYHIREIGVFGSYVRKEQTKESDVDILVDFESVPSLFDFVGLKQELSDILNIPVDLVLKKTLKPRIGERVFQEVIYL